MCFWCKFKPTRGSKWALHLWFITNEERFPIDSKIPWYGANSRPIILSSPSVMRTTRDSIDEVSRMFQVFIFHFFPCKQRGKLNRHFSVPLSIWTKKKWVRLGGWVFASCTSMFASNQQYICLVFVLFAADPVRITSDEIRRKLSEIWTLLQKIRSISSFHFRSHQIGTLSFCAGWLWPKNRSVFALHISQA